MAVDQHLERTSDFGSLLRDWRDRSDPPPSPAAARGRRSPGLRREELAVLAGISVDYLVQLEQGRATSPSASVVAALVRAMGLGGRDASVLYRSAGLAEPASAVDRSVPPSVERLLTRADHWPAAVFAADWWLLRWNAAWSALMGDPLLLDGWSRNQAYYEMTEDTSAVWVDPQERDRFRDALVADLRLARLAHPQDAGLDDLLDALQSTGDEFTDRWRAARPATYTGARKRLAHPQVGPMTLDGDVVQPAGSEVRVVVYTAVPGSIDEARLRSLTS